MDRSLNDDLRLARIAAVFGLVFVEIDAGALHPQSLAIAVRVAAAVVFVAVFARLLRRSRDGGDHTRHADGRFGPAYWTVVALEIAALAVGVLIVRGTIAVHWSVVDELRRHVTQAERAWVAFVVGVHFLGLLLVWRRASIGLLGLLITACGLVALQLARHDGHTAAGAIVAGIVPGALLLVSSAIRATRRNHAAAIAA